MKKLLLTLLSICLLTAAQAGKKKTAPNTVVIETEYGNITLVLYDNTPKHRDNFLKLANEGFFDSTLFHRVIPQFMIQGGDPDSKKAAPGAPLGNGDVGYRIDAEINDTNFHQYGAVAAARDNNPNKSSSGCQFYIVVGKKFTGEQLDGMSKQNGRNYTPAQREVYSTNGGTPHLDGNYTVFGQVIEGMDVVEKIVAEPRNHMDRPNKDMRMLKVYVPKVKKKKFLGIF
ncbi:MAG TPA: peptidylprolyl isomerase [Flavipsychrobacter sp.]